MPLKVSDGIGAWIDDFKKSDAPQFKGKSDKERRDQAIAAYLSAKRGDKMEANDYKVQVTGPDHAGIHKVKARSQDHAHQLVMKKIGQSKLPKHMQPKTRIMGESVKVNEMAPAVAGLARAAATGAVSAIANKVINSNKKHKKDVDELSMYTSKKLPNLSYPKKKTKYQQEKDRINMMKKNKQKGESVKEEMSFAVSIEGLPQMFISADSPGMLKQTLRKIVKQPSMIQNVKRVTDAQVKKTFRLKAQGREEEQDESVNELSYKTMNQYAKKSKADTDRATNSAVATILRKGDHSKDLNTMRKREKGIKLAKSRITDKIRKGQKS
jgi:hypothetical protein